ncbi:MAG: glutamine synthetase [SAR324 cluster bacterium]|nr:glutamine synthetase [SAR324 cluster bacterium]
MSSNIEDFINENRISEVECIFSDFTGIARGKIIPAKKYLAERIFKLPEYVFFHTVTGNSPDDTDDLTDSSEGDMLLKPDYSTASQVLWTQDLTANVIHDCVKRDGSDVEFAPRNVLKRVLACYDEKNWQPILAPEMEFYLTQIDSSPHNPLKPPLTRFKRVESGGSAYSMDHLSNFDPLLETLYQFCEAQQMEIDTLNHEYGTAQLEINFLHGPALKLADDVFRFKRACREAAIRHQMIATFMAKPLEDQSGSAMHFHQSVIDKTTGKNIFVDENGEFSQNFYYFIGGLQKYIKPLMIFFAPNVNSYRRLIPDCSAPVDVEWGIDNRNVGLRVPISGAINTRVENRVSGADTNPYLAFACSLAAGFLGITEKIEPNQRVTGSNYKKISLLPKTLTESLTLLDESSSAHKMLGERFVKAFKLVKQCELDDYSKVISSWERNFLLLNV